MQNILRCNCVLTLCHCTNQLPTMYVSARTNDGRTLGSQTGRKWEQKPKAAGKQVLLF